MMTSTHLRYFLAVAEHLRFRRAAEALHVSQPALSKSIQRLEDLVGAKLFERSRQGLAITPAGEILMIHAKLVTTQLSRAHEEIMELQAAVTGQIVVGAGPSVQDHVLPQAISSLRLRRPNVRIKIVAGHNDVLMPAVQRGDLDMVVGALTPHIKDARLTHEILYHDHLAVTARASHPVARSGTASLESLLGESWVLSPETIQARQWFDAVFRSRGLACITPLLEVNSIPIIKAMLLSEDILGFVPRQLYRDEERQGLLRTIPVNELLMWRPVGVSFRANGHLPALAHALIDALRSTCAAMPPAPSAAVTSS